MCILNNQTLYEWATWREGSMRGRMQEKQELSSGGRAPCSTGFPHQWVFSEPIRVSAPADVVRGCVHLQWIFFWRLFQCLCPFHDGWFTSAPAHTVLNVQQFLTKNQHEPRVPPSLFTQSHLEQFFFCFPRWKKVLKGKHFADIEEVKQKTGEALKSIKINEFKNCSKQWENVYIGVLYQMENTWKMTGI